jgi:hypothetical protein
VLYEEDVIPTIRVNEDGAGRGSDGVIPTGAVFQAKGGIWRAAPPSNYPAGINSQVPNNALLVVHQSFYTCPISLGSEVAALP